MKSIVVTLIVCCCAGVSCHSPAPSFEWLPDARRIDKSWIDRVGSRVAPKGKTYWVNARGDGKTICTDQIQAAIDCCAAQGGGRVSFEEGIYLTGALFLRSGVDLHLPEKVVLRAISDLAHYPKKESRIAGIEMPWPSAIINVLGQKNVSVSGKGRLECQGKVFWEKYWAMRQEYEKKGLRWIVDYDCDRVRGILVSRSEDVTIKGITIFQSGFWTIQLLYSHSCTVDGVTVRNNIEGRGPSTDGVDIDSSSHILVQNCDIDCNDDNICLKSGRDWDGLRVNKPTEYVVVRNCISRQGSGLVTCGSETSGGISNIVGYNLTCDGTTNAIRFKSAMNRGGYIRDIYFSDIDVKNAKVVISAELNWNPAYSYSALPEAYQGKELPRHWTTMLKKVEPAERGYTHVSNIYIANVRFDAPLGAFIQASGMGSQLPLKDFWLYNIRGKAQTGGLMKNIENLWIKEVAIATEDGKTVELLDNQNIQGEISYTTVERQGELSALRP